MARTKRARAAYYRRRPGESWEVWRVEGRDRRTKKPRAVGFLVTDSGHAPYPVAFIRGTDRVSLKIAKAVRRSHTLAGEAKALGVRDLRRRRGRTFWRRLMGVLLLPVDGLGRVIGNDITFAAGMYARNAYEPDRMAFISYTHVGLEMLREQESGTPAEPIIPMPGSVKDEKVRKLAAA